MGVDEAEALREWREAHQAYEALVGGGSLDEPKKLDWPLLVEATHRLHHAAEHAAAHRTGQEH